MVNESAYLLIGAVTLAMSEIRLEVLLGFCVLLVAVLEFSKPLASPSVTARPIAAIPETVKTVRPAPEEPTYVDSG